MVYFPFKVNLTLAGVLRREVGYGLRPLKRWLSAHYRHLLTSLPTRAEVAAVRHYDVVFAISNYTARWVRRFWRRDCQVCTPLVTPVPPQQVRQHSIVHIGRFFNDFGYNKRQHVLIQAFRRMIDRGLQGWHLHLMGGLGTRPSHREYFQELELAARGSPITLHPNAPRNAIEARLSSASIYWHASGHGANLARNPMDVEHFGISVVEAMSAGCVPMVFNAGGPPEIVGEDAGLVWNTLDELEHGTLRLIGDATAMARLRAAAMQRSSLFTDRDAFLGSVRAPLGFA
jgi:glycosyltransferase involved in cell wall biosynthesis